MLFPTQGLVTYVLLSRLPLIHRPKSGSPFDLHALSAPPAFVLSQDQTLIKITEHKSTLLKNKFIPSYSTGLPSHYLFVKVHFDQTVIIKILDIQCQGNNPVLLPHDMAFVLETRI